jgi:hypothetical protein
MLSTTVDISSTDEHGKTTVLYHGFAASITAALRVVDRNAPAPVGPRVRQRIHAEHGGQLRIGQVAAEISVYA